MKNSRVNCAVDQARNITGLDLENCQQNRLQSCCIQVLRHVVEMAKAVAIKAISTDGRTKAETSRQYFYDGKAAVIINRVLSLTVASIIRSLFPFFRVTVGLYAPTNKVTPPEWKNSIITIGSTCMPIAVVDFDFRSKFVVARPSKSYSRLLCSLPEVFVGGMQKLRKQTSLASEAAKNCLQEQGLSAGPWRASRNILATYQSCFEGNNSCFEKTQQALNDVMDLDTSISFSSMYRRKLPNFVLDFRSITEQRIVVTAAELQCSIRQLYPHLYPSNAESSYPAWMKEHEFDKAIVSPEEVVISNLSIVLLRK